MAACVSSWGREVKRVCKHSPYQSPPPPVFDTLGSERNSEGAYGEIFSDAKIGITYMYSFLLGDKGILIFRTDNPDRAREVIILNNLSFVADKDLSSLI